MLEGIGKVGWVTHVTRASIRSTSIVIGGSGIEVADEAEASADSDPDDVYEAPNVDPMSSSGDEFDDRS